jgi:hypothetical protein
MIPKDNSMRVDRLRRIHAPGTTPSDDPRLGHRFFDLSA